MPAYLGHCVILVNRASLSRSLCHFSKSRTYLGHCVILVNRGLISVSVQLAKMCRIALKAFGSDSGLMARLEMLAQHAGSQVGGWRFWGD